MLKKFRVISDLHLDINERHPLQFDDDVFTVICGDTSGDPETSIKWIKDNIKYGVGVSGNHLPYNSRRKTMQELRQELADAFPASSGFTYLDAETGTYAKEVDGIVFLGSCGYSDFKIKHEFLNPNGDIEMNMRNSEWHMNDYRWGEMLKEDGEGKRPMKAADCAAWNKHALRLFNDFLNENEKLAQPKPVVLVTHFAWIDSTLKYSWYVNSNPWSPRELNFASYASDLKDWLLSHKSIKCYCYGHVHCIQNDQRCFDIVREDGSKLLVVNNCRGYVGQGHDTNFKKDLAVDTKTWTASIQ